ncbi:MAG: hypothetical protein IPF92_23090 [Myxococcales bacterium]|nr:hypothetical protein [Myxococcales bacterium]
MSPRSLLLAVVVVGCSPAASPLAGEPRAPSLPEPTAVQIPPPSATPPPPASPPPLPRLSVAPDDAGVATLPARRVVVPDGKCSGRALGLGDVLKECACRTDGALEGAGSPACPGTPQGQGARVEGLVVTLELDEPKVKAGGLVRGTVHFRNASADALPLHFMRDSAIELVVLRETGAEIPVEGKGDCVATLSMAHLAGVTLAPGGEVVVKAVTPATRRRYRPGSCDTVAGSRLTPGRYSVGISNSPLYARAQPKPVAVEVVK